MTKAIGRKISQYSTDDVFIDSFESIVQAYNISGVKRANISSCLSGRAKTAGGFIWKYNEPKEVSSTEE